MGFIKPITGPGITDSVQMVSADLGAMCWDPQRGAIATVFGDNFSERYLRGEWKSPSILMYDNDFNLLGIPTVTGIVSEGNRRQAIPYEHSNEEFSTILPCDMIRLRGMWFMAAMVCQGLGNELRTIFWQSKNLVDWVKTDPYVSLIHRDARGGYIGHPGNVMITFDQRGEWVYVFGTGGLSRDNPIWLWRCAASTFPHGSWEPWGLDNVSWAWGNPNERTPILPGRYGELSCRFIQGNTVLSFFDVNEYSCAAITVPEPTDNWTTGHRVDYARGPEVFQLYGGYIAPGSRLNEPNGMRFAVSQWATSSNDPYHVIAFEDTLQAQGPLLEVPKPVEEPEPPAPGTPPKPPPLADIPKDTTMTPTELYELLLRELSASGSQPITTPEGEAITLRQAVEQIFAKERGMYGLGARPRHPNQTDDQLGHVLNARAENLFTQACVVALADQAGIDTAALYAQVQGSLK